MSLSLCEEKDVHSFPPESRVQKRKLNIGLSSSYSIGRGSREGPALEVTWPGASRGPPGKDMRMPKAPP